MKKHTTGDTARILLNTITTLTVLEKLAEFVGDAGCLDIEILNMLINNTKEDLKSLIIKELNIDDVSSVRTIVDDVMLTIEILEGGLK